MLVDTIVTYNNGAQQHYILKFRSRADHYLLMQQDDDILYNRIMSGLDISEKDMCSIDYDRIITDTDKSRSRFI